MFSACSSSISRSDSASWAATCSSTPGATCSRRGRTFQDRRRRLRRWRLIQARATAESAPTMPITQMAEHQVPVQARPAQHAAPVLVRARGGNVASVETTGPTVDDAIDAALEQLDLDEDQVELEILSEGGNGQPARVRATPRSEVTADIAPTAAAE